MKRRGTGWVRLTLTHTLVSHRANWVIAYATILESMAERPKPRRSEGRSISHIPHVGESEKRYVVKVHVSSITREYLIA